MTRQFVLLNINGFRGMTTDIDALILASSAMEDAILRVEEKYGLPHGWLNHSLTSSSVSFCATVLPTRMIPPRSTLQMGLCCPSRHI